MKLSNVLYKEILNQIVKKEFFNINHRDNLLEDYSISLENFLQVLCLVSKNWLEKIIPFLSFGRIIISTLKGLKYIHKLCKFGISNIPFIGIRKVDFQFNSIDFDECTRYLIENPLELDVLVLDGPYEPNYLLSLVERNCDSLDHLFFFGDSFQMKNMKFNKYNGIPKLRLLSVLWCDRFFYRAKDLVWEMINLESLTLDQLEFHQESFNVLLECLYRFQKLKRLSMINYRFNSKNITLLLDTLLDSKLKLNYLNLNSSIGQCNDHFDQISILLKKYINSTCGELKRLDFEGNYFNTTFLHQLSETKLEGFKFSLQSESNLLTPLGEFIKTQNSLKTIYLRETSINEFTPFFSYVSQCHFIEKLNLPIIALSNVVEEEFLKMIHSLKYLKKLNLQSSLMNLDKNVKSNIISSCFQHSSLTNLNLNANGIEEYFAEILVNSIKSNLTITKLNLSQNFLQPCIFEIINTVLFQNSTIRELNLTSNFLKDGQHTTGAVHNLPILNHSLYTLSISCLDFLPSQFSTLFTALNHHPNLRNLDCEFENIDKKKFSPIYKFIKENPLVKLKY